MLATAVVYAKSLCSSCSAIVRVNKITLGNMVINYGSHVMQVWNMEIMFFFRVFMTFWAKKNILMKHILSLFEQH